jgi:hypothetical protein
LHGEHEKRETGDDAGEDQREKYEATEERFAWEAGAVEGERGEEAQRERERYGSGGDEEAVEDGVPDGAVREKLAIPVERQMLWRESADAVAVERIKDEDDEREIDEREDERGVESEQRRTGR